MAVDPERIEGLSSLRPLSVARAIRFAGFLTSGALLFAAGVYEFSATIGFWVGCVMHPTYCGSNASFQNAEFGSESVGEAVLILVAIVFFAQAYRYRQL